MLFAIAFSVPAATPAASPTSQEIAVAHGVIHLVAISFLRGPNGLVHVRVRRSGLHQIVPTSSGDIVGDGNTVQTVLREPMLEPPYTLTVEAWSPLCDYSHLVTVEVHILPQDTLEPKLPELGLIPQLLALFVRKK